MNWVGELVQREVAPSDTVLDLGCGIMQATLDTCPTYPPTKLQCTKIIGVDIYQPYLDFLRERGIQTLHWDLKDVPYPFPSKSTDVILVTDVLEHMDTTDHADQLLQEAERIGRKKIVVLTPRKFTRNIHGTQSPFPYHELGDNKHQEHQVLIERNWLRERGFHTEIRKGFIYGIKPLKLRILHIWNQAGVASLMAKHQRKMGHKADVVKRGEFDRLGINKFYNSYMPKLGKPPSPISSRRKLYDVSHISVKKIIRKFGSVSKALRFYLLVRKMATDYDILHIHSQLMTLFFTPFKKKIMEFHGDDIRLRPSMKPGLSKIITRLFLLVAKRIMPLYVSTPDLLREIPEGVYIPNPVDTEHFKQPKWRKATGTALYSRSWYETPERAKTLAEIKGWPLTVLDRVENKIVPYDEFPPFLGDFEYFIDRHEIPSLSKTALEALNMGLKVVAWDGTILRGLPERHLPDNVARTTLQIYYSTLGE